MEKDTDPLAGKARMPFSPTIRPSLVGGQGGISAWLYALVALALCGFVLYQLRVQHLDFANWRVLIASGGALYFAVRTGMMLALARINKDDGEKDDQAEKGP